MKVVYFSFDGKEFDNDRECLAYERSTKINAGKCAVIADKDGNVISIGEILSGVRSAEDVDVISCQNYEEYDIARQVLYEDFGLDFPNWGILPRDVSRFWVWNNRSFEWMDMREILDELEYMTTLQNKVLAFGKDFEQR